MRSKILLTLLVGAFFSTSLMAKYMKISSDCHYIYTKRSDYINTKDVKCIVKMVAASTNQNTPKNYGAVTLTEAIPKGTTIISKYTVTNRKTFNKNIKNGSLKEAMTQICKTPALRLAFQQGLVFSNKFYSKSGKIIKNMNINQKVCGIR